MLELAAMKLTPSPACEGKAVSYHRPCHLASIPGAVERAESLLRRVLGEKFKPMKGADRCCGFGGTFKMVDYEKSRDMGTSKIKCAEESETDIVATSCSGCIHHLKESAARSNSRIQVLHTSELFDF
jgi:Fe-S oxidoreductase